MNRPFIGAVAFLLLNVSFPAHSEDVQAGDISEGRITLIGRLGKPVGTVVTLEGQLLAEPKSTNGHIVSAFRVSRVDGQELKKAQIIGLEFRPSQGIPPLQARQFVKFTGYEGAAYIGTPDAARATMGSDASPLDWKFQSLVHVIKVL